MPEPIPGTPEQLPYSPLHGIRVLELSQIVAGPSCGRILGELGAEIFKIEQLEGDPYRNTFNTIPDEGKHFQSLNMSKKSVAINLQDSKGQALLQALAKEADVVLTNFRFGVPERLGFGYETLKAINPRLIYARVTGFGSKTEAASKPAGDTMMQAYSGLAVNGGKLNEDGLPVLANGTIADYAAGMGCAIGILAAIIARQTTGEGQIVDASLLRGALVLQDTAVMREPLYDSTIRDPLVASMQAIIDRGGSFSEVIATRSGTRRGGFSPITALFNGPRQAKDGVVTLGALTPANREAARRALQITEEEVQSVADPAAPDHAANLAKVKQRISDYFRTKTCEEWVAILDREGCPSGKVNIPEMMSDDPIVTAEGHMQELVHGVTGPQRVVGPLVDLSVTPARHQHAATSLGEYTRRVLTSVAGLTDAEVDALVAEGVVKEYVRPE